MLSSLGIDKHTRKHKNEQFCFLVLSSAHDTKIDPSLSTKLQNTIKQAVITSLFASWIKKFTLFNTLFKLERKRFKILNLLYIKNVKFTDATQLTQYLTCS